MILTDKAVIANGATTSSAVGIEEGYVFSLEIPTIDTAIVYALASTSRDGTYRRVLKTDGTGDWNIASSTGNKFIFPDELAPYVYLKLETSSTQTASRTFTFTFKK